MHRSNKASEEIGIRKQLSQQNLARLEVGALIIETMNKRNVSRDELAKRLSANDEYVSLLLAGETRPTLQELSNVFTALDSSLHFSVGDNNEPTMSLGRLIEIATDAAEQSPLGLEAKVCLCESDGDTFALVDAALDPDDDGCTFLVSTHSMR